MAKYTNIKDKLKHGTWIFTCSMKPLQFDKFLPKEDNKEDYPNIDFGSDKWLNIKYDDFQTIEGSNHSLLHCSCGIISEEYAKWFLDNNIHKLYDNFKDKENSWELYEKAVREKCALDNIEYEGY